MLFKKKLLYIKVYKNKIEVTNLENGHTVSKNSLEKFSTDRIIVAKFNIAESLIREIIVELNLKKGIFSPQLNILIQQMERFEDGLSDIEARGYRDICEQAGATEIHLVDHNQKLSIRQAIIEISRKDNF